MTISLFGSNSAGQNKSVYDISLKACEPPYLILATSLHELGHVLRWKELNEIGKGAEVKKLFDIRAALFFGMISEKSVQALYSEEAIAWDLGEQFAKDNGIELGSWFYETKSRSLKTYEQLRSRTLSRNI